MNEQKLIRILGVPMDMGAGRRGVDMGPSAIRYARLAQAIEKLHLICEDCGDLKAPLHETAASPNPKLRHLDPIVSICLQVRDHMKETFDAGHFPLVLGGDHSLSIGTLSAVTACWERPGVLWIDAHADFNTDETTPSGNIHGMSLAASTGRGGERLLELFEDKFIDPHRVCIIGARSLDEGEKDLLRESGVHIFTMTAIDRDGLQKVVERALDQIKPHCDAMHVSFDMDVINPDIAPGVGTPVEGGLGYREAHFLMELLAEESSLLKSLEVVEVNPILDERNRTGRLAVELIASALGKRIF